MLFLEFINVALNADLKPSTHPIQVGIKHTGDAVSAFDMISYCKGASWIKTMDNFIGRKSLQEGLQAYVQKYAYKNSKLNDFVECMNEALKKNDPSCNLPAWTETWLLKSGPNQIEAEFVE